MEFKKAEKDLLNHKLANNNSIWCDLGPNKNNSKSISK